MHILYTIAVLSFLVLTWAAFAIRRHIRGTHQVLTPVNLAAEPALKATRNPQRTRRYPSAQRHDRAFAHADSGNLQDPTRKPRKS